MPQVTKPWLSSRFSSLFVCFRTCYPSTHLISIFAVSFYFPYRSDDASEEKKIAKATLLLIRWNYNTRSTQRRKRRKGRIFTGIDIALEHSCFQGNFCFFFFFLVRSYLWKRYCEGDWQPRRKASLERYFKLIAFDPFNLYGFSPLYEGKVESSLFCVTFRFVNTFFFDFPSFFNSFQFHFFFVIYQTFLLFLNASHVSFFSS